MTSGVDIQCPYCKAWFRLGPWYTFHLWKHKKG